MRYLAFKGKAFFGEPFSRKKKKGKKLDVIKVKATSIFQKSLKQKKKKGPWKGGF